MASRAFLCQRGRDEVSQQELGMIWGTEDLLQQKLKHITLEKRTGLLDSTKVRGILNGTSSRTRADLVEKWFL